MDNDLREKVASSVASSLLFEHYGITAETITDLPGEYDANFCVTLADSTRITLKVMHSSRSIELIEMQARAMIHVSSRTPEIPVPRTLPSKTGALFARVMMSTNIVRFLWVLDWIDGKPFAVSSPRAEPLLMSLGEAVGSLTKGLVGFSHPATLRENNKWNLLKAGWIRSEVFSIQDASRRALVTRVINEFEMLVLPAEWNGSLPHGVIHGDVNDYNVITRATRGCHPHIVGIIDFGDMHEGIVVADLAIAIAYGIAGSPVPLDAARAIVRGYVSRKPISAIEINLLWTLVSTRLAVSVVNSALRKILEPKDPYIVISEAPAWESLARMSLVPIAVAAAALREAAGIAEIIPTPANIIHSMCEADKTTTGQSVMDGITIVTDTFGEGEISPIDASSLFDWASLPGVSGMGNPRMRDDAVRAVHCARFCSIRPAPPRTLTPGVEPALCMVGLGLLLARGDSVRVPRPAIIEAIILPTPDRCSVLLLRHEAEEGNGCQNVWTLWSGLELDEHLMLGAQLSTRMYIGVAPRDGTGIIVSAWTGNDAVSLALRAPLWVRASDIGAWRAAGLSDPTRFIRLRSPLPRTSGGPIAPLSATTAIDMRTSLFGSNVRLSYSKPIRAVRGEGSYLIDANGIAYVDAYNNVPSVGHAHPRVAKAIAAAAARLQTNTRYLNDSVLSYSQQLLATFPPPLSVVFLVASGSEANDLALRIARAATGREDVICLDHAYHGHTNTLIGISPYKFAGKGGKGPPKTTHVAPCPNVYRGPYKRDDDDAGEKYAEAGVGTILANGALPAAFIAETLPSVAGQIELPSGYLKAVYERVRATGGVCIADEVQTGFGRLGPDAFWAFQTHDVVPDIVTLGKPIGNGFPMGAVITTCELASKFDNGMEYFCTGGGARVRLQQALASLMS